MAERWQHGYADLNRLRLACLRGSSHLGVPPIAIAQLRERAKELRSELEKEEL